MDFFKSFGMGLLYFVLSPFIIAACIVVGLVGIFNHLVQFAIMLIHFFKGDNLFPTYKEDLLASQKLETSLTAKRKVEEPQPTKPQQTFIQQNFYTNSNQQGVPNMPMGNAPYFPGEDRGISLNPQAIPTKPQPQAIEMNLEEANDNE